MDPQYEFNPKENNLTNIFDAKKNPRLTSGNQGETRDTRGTGLSHAPTLSTPMTTHQKPTGGITPLGNDKGPQKQVHDNLTHNAQRNVQATYNTGPNRGEAEKRLGGLQTYDAQPKGIMGTMKSKLGGFFGMEHERHVGMGIETSDLFQKAKPVEVADKSDKKK